MNPAYSVILFTTASGAGYGLLALLGWVGLRHGPASSPVLALALLGIALVLITIGLLSSTFHLGRPERAWRALSQWRTSWLSREGVAAVLTYPVTIAFGTLWSGFWPASNWIGVLGLLTFVMCAITVYCTGKIYSTLKTIPQWHHGLTVPIYLAFAIATGGALLAALATLFDRFQSFQVILAGVALVITASLKLLYWRSIDKAPREFTMEQATGLGPRVRQWEVPHTNVNFIQKEMGYVVARRHAITLRKLVLALLAVSVLLCIASAYVSPWFSLPLTVCALAAAVFERWLFFAEAVHVVNLYYGAPRA